MGKKDITLKAWRKEYMRIVRMRQIATSTVDEKARCARLLCLEIGDKKLRKIRPVHIASVMRAVWERGEQSKARRVLVTARDMLAEAVFAGKLERNPAAAVKPLPYKVKRGRLSIKHWRQTQAALSIEGEPWRRLLAVLALATAQRRSDLARMRFNDVWGGYLHVEQVKTGARIALPLELRLRAIGMTLREIIDLCRAYSPPGEHLLRKSTGAPLTPSSLSKAFAAAFASTVRWKRTDLTVPSLAEIRSLSERLYSAQGIDTQTLLGHKRPATTAIYHDDRGLSRSEGWWKKLSLKRRRKAKFFA